MPGRKSVRVPIRVPEFLDRGCRLALETAWRSFLSLRDPAALDGTAGPPGRLSLGEKLDHAQPTVAPATVGKRPLPSSVGVQALACAG